MFPNFVSHIFVINRPLSDFSGPQATFKKKTSPQRENPSEAAGRWHLGILLLDVGLHVLVTLDVLPHNRQGSFGLPQHQEIVQLRIKRYVQGGERWGNMQVKYDICLYI